MGYEHYIGVDLHKAFFQACAVTPDGTRLWEGRWPRSADGIAALQARCTPGTAVAVEASTPTFHFADALTGHAGQVVIIDPVKTRLKAGYAAKTDRLDARRLADALRRDSVVGIYHPPPAIRDLRELCRSRHALVQTRTALTLRLGAVLLRHGLGNAPPRLYRPRGLAWVDQLTLPAEAAASVQRLRRVLARVTEELDAVDADVARAAAAIRSSPRSIPSWGLGRRWDSSFARRSARWRGFRHPATWRATRVWCRAWTRVRAACVRPHHAAGVAVAAMGAGGGGDPWAQPPRCAKAGGRGA